MKTRLQDYTDIETGAILRLDTSEQKVVEFEAEGTKEGIIIQLDFEQAKRMAEQLGAWVGYHLA